VQPTVTRPANVTAYTAGDVVGGAFQISTGMTSGQRIMLLGADIQYQVAALPTGMTTFTLHFYNVTPPSAIADNAPWTFGSTDRASYLGFVTLGAFAALGTGTTPCLTRLTRCSRCLAPPTSSATWSRMLASRRRRTLKFFCLASNSQVSNAG